MHCTCGYPIPSPSRVMLEGFLGAKRIAVSQPKKCIKCGRINIVKG